MIGAEQFAAHEGRRDLPQHRPGRAARHRRARRRARSRASSAAPASTTSTASTSPTDHPLVRRWRNVVLTPHIGGATYDTEANHSKLIADGLATLLAGGKPDNLVNPEVLA